MKLRILHIDTEHSWRGGEQQAYSLIMGLRAKGHDNMAVVRKGSALARRLQEISINILQVSPLTPWDPLVAYRIHQILVDQKIHLIHAHTANGLAVGALSSLGLSLPLVSSRRVDFHMGKNPLTVWKYQRAARILAISEGVKSVLIQDGVSKEKIAVVKSGVDFSKYERIRKISKKDLGISDETCLIGLVAALEDHKDHATFIKAMAILQQSHKNVQALLLGEGSLRPALEALAHGLGVSDAIQFMGFKEYPLDYLSGCDLFCLSSKLEGLGTSILDAMALKVPVVATRTGGIPELIEDGQTGYLADPMNPDELASALKRAMNDLHHNRDLLERAYQKARQFDVIHTIQQTEKIYLELIQTS